MQFKNLRTTAALACGVGMAALALTGCNVDGKVSAASGPSAQTAPSSSATGSAATGTHNGKAVAAHPDQGDTPSCMASELNAELQIQDPGSNREEAEKAIATLTLTNRSGETCYLPAGWTPLGKGGRNNYTAIPATQVSYPGPGMTITLRPGRSAFAGIKWHTTKGCPGGVTDGLGVAWHSTWIPLTYHGLDDGYQPPICDSLTLGTLQPTMNGVNFT
ncbi:DUF4232 domain-containing protein [Actinoallomurus rhizosphaericola]|uniref:DUF4232 domain-containing protein n=1 Tax=Actinoallomurus rhizosphaericola TaxID=2952536 RepID=UPI002091F2F8|nr:DUF4232 domain-containing protein [Actinoallomurus rhizosphaericola]MCO6000175.1 DUF4232 domain-containing protein [Actinoallomurus rhizosphaericola]